MTPGPIEVFQAKSDGFHSLADGHVIGAPSESGRGLWGMNFEPSRSTDDPSSLYEQQAEVARIYVATGQTDMHNEPEYVRAYGLGCRTFVFSWKDTAGAASSVGSNLATIDSDVTWYGVAHQEPEDLTASTYQTLQAAHMPVVRAHGGIPTSIFQSISFHNARNPFDLTPWILPAGTIEVLGWDYYPDKESFYTQSQRKVGLVQAMADFGVERTITGEYGIPVGSTTYTAATVTEYKSLMYGFSEANCWWANQFSGKPDYHLAPAAAAAWFA